jgi:hypothetical protein
VREDNIDLGEGILPIHILDLTCAVHLRQEHGFKRWQISGFLEAYPWLIREDGTFAFAALHYLMHVLVHVEEAAVPLGESGTVAFVRLIKPPEAPTTESLEAIAEISTLSLAGSGRRPLSR